MNTTVHYTELACTFGSDRPELVPGVMQVVYEDGVPCAVGFLCPCGCGDSIYLPVCVGIKETHKWLFSPGPTLHPSVRKLNGCKSHFNIEEGGRVKMHTS